MAKPPRVPSSSTGFADKARDLESLRAALDDAAKISGPLWLSYLFALFYFLVAAGSVTHKDLFLERPVKLPFLGVDLPLTGFFAVAPPIFVFLHGYVLLHFVILTDKAAAFDEQLRAQVAGGERRRWLRRQLPTNLFVQLLAGPREVRRGLFGWLLWLVAVLTLVIGPVVLLLFLQLQFLPYHYKPITWVQRAMVVADLGLLWALWPRLTAADGATRRQSRWYRRRVRVPLHRLGKFVLGIPPRLPRPGRRAAAIFGTAFAGWLAFLIGTFPGETIDEYASRLPLRQRLIDGKPHVFGQQQGVDPATLRPDSLFSNRLVLPGFDLSEDPRFDSSEKLAFAHVTLHLRARDLRRAVFDRANLRKVELDDAELQGASLDGAQMQGASLDGAQMQGASLDGAQMQGASLAYAQMQGTSLDFAQMQGASLGGAQMQGASLDRAQMQGASLFRAQMQGASLDGAQMQGASLGYAQMQGASLDRAQMQGATMTEPNVWRADPRVAANAELWLGLPPAAGGGSEPEALSSSDYDALKSSLERDIPTGPLRDEALARIGRLDPKNGAAGEDEAIARSWRDLQSSGPLAEDVLDRRVAALGTLGCEGEGAPYLIAGLAGNFLAPDWPLPQPAKQALATAFLAESCAGAKGLDDWVRGSIKRVADGGSYWQ